MRSGTLLFICALLLLATAFYFFEREQDVQAAADTPTMAISLGTALASPTATLTPSPIPTATPDWAAATVIARFATETERVLQTNLQISQNNAALATSIDEQTEHDKAALAWTKTVEPTVIPMTETKQSIEATQFSAVKTAEYIEPTLIVAVANAKAEADFAPWRALVEIVIKGAAGIAFVLLAVAALMAVSRRPAIAPTASAPSLRPIIHVDNSPTDTERVPAPPGEVDAIRDWASAALAGESLAVNQWEKSGRYKGDYRPLYGWAGRWGLLMRDSSSGETVLSQKGARVIGEWLIANPPTPGENLI